MGRLRRQDLLHIKVAMVAWKWYSTLSEWKWYSTLSEWKWYSALSEWKWYSTLSEGKYVVAKRFCTP